MRNLILFVILFAGTILQAQEIPSLKEKDGKYALQNDKNVVISAYYSAVYDFEFGVAIVRQTTKFGAINKKGEVVIPVEFSTDEIGNEYNNYLEKYIEENPNDQDVIKYLEIAEENKRIAEENKRIAEENKRIAELTTKAENFYNDKEYEKAISSYNDVLKITEGNFELFKNLAYSYYAIDDLENTILYFENALVLDEDVNIVYALAQVYSSAEKYQKSLETYDRMGSGYSNYVNRGKAAVYYNMKDYENAYKFIAQVCEDEPDNYNNFFNFSFYALFVNKPDEAIIAAKKSLELEPEKTGVNSNLALGYVLNNQYELAEPIYLEWKDKHFPNDTRTCKEVFLTDIADLEAAGITHKDFAKVKKILK